MTPYKTSMRQTVNFEVVRQPLGRGWGGAGGRSTRTKKITVELQWLEHLWDYEKLFETGVVRAIEGLL